MSAEHWHVVVTDAKEGHDAGAVVCTHTSEAAARARYVEAVEGYFAMGLRITDCGTSGTMTVAVLMRDHDNLRASVRRFACQAEACRETVRAQESLERAS